MADRNIKVEVADGVFEGLDNPNDVQNLQDFLTEMKGVANTMTEVSTTEDFLRALDTIGVVEILEIESDEGHALVVKKVIN